MQRLQVQEKGGLSIGEIFRNPIALPLVAFSACFVLTFVVGSLFLSPGASRAVTGLGLVGDSTLTISSSTGGLGLDVMPTPEGALASASHAITVSTDSPVGYSLNISMPAAPELTTTSGSFAIPSVLASNTWGYALAGVGGFDASYDTPTPSSTSVWANPSASTTIKNTVRATASDTTDIYYGAKIDTSLVAGTYTNTVRYTATTNVDSIAAPTIISITPNSGAVAGGTAIQIVGTGFTVNDESTTKAVTLDGVACENVSISSNTPNVGQDTIYCDTPAHAEGAVDVAVTTLGGTATAGGGYTYTPPVPVISSVIPDSGHFRGGETIMITGVNFTGASAVNLGGSACRSFTVHSDTSISCVTSGVSASLLGGANNTMTAATNAVSVNVTNAYGASATNSLFTYRYINKNTTAAGSYMDVLGTDIALGSKIYVGGAECTNMKITGDGTAACNTPIAAAGDKTATISEPTADGNMQNWSGCSAISTPSYTTTDWAPYTRVLTDTRNGQTYRVRKMPDGKCWMIDDLKLADYTLTSADSDVSSSFTIPANPVQGSDTHGNGACIGGTTSSTGTYLTCDGSNNQSAANNAFVAYSDPTTADNTYYFNCANKIGISSGSNTGCGYLYNWYTTTAGTGNYGMVSTNASSSICPAGWKLPDGSWNSSNEFAILNNAMATGSATDSSESSAKTRPNWWYNGMFEGSLAGYNAAKFYSSGYEGYYWSSAAAFNEIYGYYLRFSYLEVATTGTTAYKYVGSAVRCLAR